MICRGFVYTSAHKHSLNGLNMLLVICVLTPSLNLKLWHRASVCDLPSVALSSVTVFSVVTDDRDVISVHNCFHAHFYHVICYFDGLDGHLVILTSVRRRQNKTNSLQGIQ